MAIKIQVVRGSLPSGRYTVDEAGTLGGQPLFGARFELLPERKRSMTGGRQLRTVAPGGAGGGRVMTIGPGGTHTGSGFPSSPEKLVQITFANGHTVVAKMMPDALLQFRSYCTERPPPPATQTGTYVWIALAGIAVVALFAAFFSIVTS